MYVETCPVLFPRIQELRFRRTPRKGFDPCSSAFQGFRVLRAPRSRIFLEENLAINVIDLYCRSFAYAREHCKFQSVLPALQPRAHVLV